MNTRRTNRSLRPAILLASLTLVPTMACQRHEKSQETQTTGASQEAKPSVGQVKDEPARFYGKRITLTGEVEHVEDGGRSFELEGNGWLFEPELRVLTRAPVKLGGAPLSKDEKVIVTGTLRPFVTADVERDLGWDLKPKLEIDLRDKPVLIADEIRRIEPSATWSASKPEGEIVSTVVLVTTTTPEVLVGQHITLDHAVVQGVTDKGVWIGPSHFEQTFVLPTGGASISDIKPGDLVDLRGTVKKTPPAADAIKTWGLAPTMRDVVEREPLYIEASEIKHASGDEKTKG